jgi:hypothetical protein
MIAETTGWLADGVGHPRGPDQVRGGWINHLRRAGADVDAEVFDQRWASAFAKARVELAVARGAEIAAELAEAKALPAEPKPEIKFDPSDQAPKAPAPPTIEDKNRTLEELADLYESDPLAYAEGRKDWAKRLFTTVLAVDKAVKMILAKRTDAGEQNLATKLVAVGMQQQLWQSPSGDSYATVLTGGHRENYRIGSRAFERWLRSEYGDQNKVLVDGEMIPHVPGAGAVKDAISNLDGIAEFRGVVREPAIRVGGNNEVIWIDLGGEDWRAVRVTTERWDIVTGPEVAFVRSERCRRYLSRQGEAAIRC